MLSGRLQTDRPPGSQLIRNSSPVYGTSSCTCADRGTMTRGICAVQCIMCLSAALYSRSADYMTVQPTVAFAPVQHAKSVCLSETIVVVRRVINKRRRRVSYSESGLLLPVLWRDPSVCRSVGRHHDIVYLAKTAEAIGMLFGAVSGAPRERALLGRHGRSIVKNTGREFATYLCQKCEAAINMPLAEVTREESCITWRSGWHVGRWPSWGLFIPLNSIAFPSMHWPAVQKRNNIAG